MPDRLLWLDAIRVVSAQLIVLHHLSIYGPLGQSLREVLPSLIGWFDEYGRIAVQVFLVIGGMLCARALPVPASASGRSLMAALGRRYLRLFPPLYAALALVLLAAIPGRIVLNADWVTPWPGIQWLPVHLLGLQDYAGIEALSAGAWYVAIDFQLHAVALALVWFAGRAAPDPGVQDRVFQVLVVLFAGASLVWVNRHPAWDFQPLYFFGSFALGFAAGWLGPGDAARGARLAGLSVIGLAVLALVLEWRLRIAVELVCALVIAAGLRGAGARFDHWLGQPGPLVGGVRRAVIALADISYPLFLVHFAVCIVANAIYVRWTGQGVAVAALMFVAAWLASVPVAMMLRTLVEKPLVRRIRRHGS